MPLTTSQIEEEARLIAASRSRRQHDVDAIKLNLSRGMSRKSLIAIYGSDLVDDVLAGMAPTDPKPNSSRRR